jgi:acyl carrier protein
MVDGADLRTTRVTARERLIVVVRQILGPPAALRPLPIDARLSDLGLSSLKMVSLMLAIEVQFNIAIPARDINPENFKSIATVEAMITRLSDPASGQE